MAPDSSTLAWKIPWTEEPGGLSDFTFTFRFPHGSVVKNIRANAGDISSIPGLVRALGEGNGNPLQYSCLGNPMDKGPWRFTVPGVAKSQTRLSN